MSDEEVGSRRKRQHIREKVREEFRDDIRATLAGSLDLKLLRKEARELVDEAAAKALKSALEDGRIDAVIRRLTRDEIDRLLNKERKVTVVGDSPFRSMVEKAIKEEFAVYARDFIAKNLSVRIIDGAEYPGAGSF